MNHGNCSNHRYSPLTRVTRSIGRVEIETCDNCLSVRVIQRRVEDDEHTVTDVEMKDSAYNYVK